MSDANIGVIGVGNPLRGDDGVGISVLEELRERGVGEELELIDGGTGGISLLHHLNRFRKVLMVDAIFFGGKCGEIHLFQLSDLKDEAIRISTHESGILDVLNLSKSLGELPEVYVLGIQPEDVSFRTGLSEGIDVGAIADRACGVIDKLTDLDADI